MRLILGSTSPRRIEILSFFSLPIVTTSPKFEETNLPFTDDPENYAIKMAENKAISIENEYPSDPILTADTIVYANGKLFTKPKDEKEAFSILKELSVTEHQVYTGVCVSKGGKRFSAAEMTTVEFNTPSEKEIHAYHNHFYFQDKAGGYTIQNAGSIIVKRIDGCFYNVMGLPINTTRILLAKVGIDLWQHL